MSGKNPARSINLDQIKTDLNISKEDQEKPAFLKFKNDVFYLMLNNNLNTFNRDFLRLIHKLLDEVENHDGPTALVTMGFNNKYFSTGMDLKFIAGLNAISYIDVQLFVIELMHLYGRLLGFPVPTISVLNGHAIAGGLMLAFAHEVVLMRDDFGQLALTEIELGMPLPPGMNSVIQQRTGNTNEYRQLVLTAKRFTPKQAFAAGWLDGIFEPEQLFSKAVEMAEFRIKFGENKTNYKKLKLEMNKTAYSDCFNKQHANGFVGEPKL